MDVILSSRQGEWPFGPPSVTFRTDCPHLRPRTCPAFIMPGMFMYAGIDEAGYGPKFGPLVVGCAVIALERVPRGGVGEDGAMPDVWALLARCVCRDLRDKKGRIAVNDSKKLRTAASGITHLERGVLAFAALAQREPAHIGDWLDALGERAHHDLASLPWYAPTDDDPWDALPAKCTSGEIAIARSMLTHSATDAGVRVLDLGAAVVFEDRFNEMVARTHSKAAMSFTFVSAHLKKLWDRFGDRDPVVVVDRQSGRTHYRELLALCLPGAKATVIEESSARSAYVFEAGRRRMTIRFEVEAEQAHLPVALASMISKYTRELLMARFQRYFSRCAPQVKPTAGYGSDAQRFHAAIEPLLDELAIAPSQLVRMS